MHEGGTDVPSVVTIPGSNRARDEGTVLFYGLVVLLVFAPLFRAGNRPFPLMVMELLALALLGWRFWRPPATGQPLPRAVWSLLVLLFLLPLWQLLPTPATTWAHLPGRSFYAQALQHAAVTGPGFEWRAISLIPSATEASWLALLPPLAVFLVAMRLERQRLTGLVLVFLGIATAEALLGLIQYGNGSDSLFRLGNNLMGDSASGTYINRNHLAGLLEMALPIGLALVVATVGHGRPRHSRGSRRHRTLRQWLARFSVARINQAAIYGAVTLAILLGLIFTRSRAGVSMAMLGILLSTVMFSNRLGGRNIYGLIGTLTAVGIGLAALVGLVPVWKRFTLQDSVQDGRWPIFDATAQAIGEFFPLGSGVGTFEQVIRRFHPTDFPGVTINHAHNDYLEWLLELGLIAGLLIAIWLILYFRQWGQVWRRGEWTSFRFMQAGAGIALLLLMLHSLVDFNLRIPANAVFAALLVAIFFYRSPEEERKPSLHRRESSDERGGTYESRLPTVYTVPPENQINPFAP